MTVKMVQKLHVVHLRPTRWYLRIKQCFCTHSGSLPGLLGHAERLVVLHTWREKTHAMLKNRPAGGDIPPRAARPRRPDSPAARKADRDHLLSRQNKKNRRTHKRRRANITQPFKETTKKPEIFTDLHTGKQRTKAELNMKMRQSWSELSRFDKWNRTKNKKTKKTAVNETKIVIFDDSAAHHVCQLRCTCLTPQRAINRERKTEGDVCVSDFYLLFLARNLKSFGFNVSLSLSLSTAPVRGEKVFTCGLVSSRTVERSGPRVSGRHFGSAFSRWGAT